MKYAILSCLIFSALFAEFTEEQITELPHPYNTLKEVLPFKEHDLMYYNGPLLEYLIKTNDIKCMIELGSFYGCSTRHLASCLPEDGKLIAVDHWQGGADHHNNDYAPLLVNLYEHFLSNIIRKGLCNKIIPWKMSTKQGAIKAKEEKLQIDLIYVDASHDEKSVYEDLCNWYPLLKPGGILCGDDWWWGDGLPIQHAVARFAKENTLELYVPNDRCWILKPKVNRT